MEPSMFIQFLARFFPGIVVSQVNKLNDTTNPLPYLHKRMLRTTFSVSGKWESLASSNSRIMADVVAMDSELPLKKRGSIAKASGNIPKLGLEMKLNENQLTAIGVLLGSNNQDQQTEALKLLFEDTPKAITAVYERNEHTFLEALSTGVCLVDDQDNAGAGFRVDYGFLAANKFAAANVPWSNVNATPFDDIDRVLAKAQADGSTITNVLMDKTAFNNMVKTKQVIDQFAFSVGFTGSTTPRPSLSQMNTIMTDKYGFTIEIVDRVMRYEEDGVETVVRPWANGMVTFVTDSIVGDLVWAQLAEMLHPVAGVSYQTADGYILVSKFRQNRPTLGEFTQSQSRVLPVLTNVNRIYQISSTEVQA